MEDRRKQSVDAAVNNSPGQKQNPASVGGEFLKFTQTNHRPEAMFARLVKIDGHEIWVSCSPSTPLPEVLRRAAKLLEQVQT